MVITDMQRILHFSPYFSRGGSRTDEKSRNGGVWSLKFEGDRRPIFSSTCLGTRAILVVIVWVIPLDPAGTSRGPVNSGESYRPLSSEGTTHHPVAWGQMSRRRTTIPKPYQGRIRMNKIFGPSLVLAISLGGAHFLWPTLIRGPPSAINRRDVGNLHHDPHGGIIGSCRYNISCPGPSAITGTCPISISCPFLTRPITSIHAIAISCPSLRIV